MKRIGQMTWKLIITVLVPVLFLTGCNGAGEQSQEMADLDPAETVTASQTDGTAMETVAASQADGTATEKVSVEEGGDREAVYEMNEGKDGILVGDLLDCVDFLGKTANEIGIPTAVLEPGVIGTKTYLDGTICGKTDYGVLHFDDYANTEITGEDAKATGIWIHIKEVSYEELVAELTGRFGEPIGSGEEPYVETNGGAVMWTTFETDTCKIRLSAASERAYLEINIELK